MKGLVRTRGTLLSSLAIGLLWVSSGTVKAMEPMVLPAFEVTSLDGTVVPSPELVHGGKWLLFYVAPHSESSKSLLRLLKKGEPGLDATRVVVVVGGTAEEARTVRESCPALSEAGWYTDPTKGALTQLKVQGTPTVLGLKDEALTWCAQGTLADPQHVKSALTSWLQN